MGLRLFVYGTLARGAGTPMACWLAERTVDAVAARVPGRLYALADSGGCYPLLRPGGGAVGGTLLTLAGPRGVLARLDAYEGRQYRRVAMRARTAGGGRAACQAYVWTTALPEDARAVPDGDFLAWLAASGRAIFREPLAKAGPCR